MSRTLSISGIYRLALYNRYLSTLHRNDHEYVSSQELADATGHTAAQVRKDLTCHGRLGEPGKGYEIRKLRRLLTSVFGKGEVRKVVLVGVGNLGLALIAYRGFQMQQFKIVAAFDRDVRIVGKYVEDVMVYDIRELDSVIARTGADIAIVSVPAYSAQPIVDRLVVAGIGAILNFAPRRISVPEGVKLQSVDMSMELDRLYYLLKNPG